MPSNLKKHKSNIRHTWATIKEIIGKIKNKHDFPDHFTVDGMKITQPFDIANCFNNFFAQVGPSLSKSLSHNGNKTVSSYMKQVISSSFHFECVDTTTVHKLISDLANKNSSGPDGITAKLLKRLSCHIAVPLTIIINQ